MSTSVNNVSLSNITKTQASITFTITGSNNNVVLYTSTSIPVNGTLPSQISAYATTTYGNVTNQRFTGTVLTTGIQYYYSFYQGTTLLGNTSYPFTTLFITNVPANITTPIGSPSTTITNPTTNVVGTWTYSSSNTSIASISANSIIYGAIGTTTITGTFAPTNLLYSSDSSTTFTVTVNSPASVTNFTASNVTKTSGTLNINFTTTTGVNLYLYRFSSTVPSSNITGGTQVGSVFTTSPQIINDSNLITGTIYYYGIYNNIGSNYNLITNGTYNFTTLSTGTISNVTAIYGNNPSTNALPTNNANANWSFSSNNSSVVSVSVSGGNYILTYVGVTPNPNPATITYGFSAVGIYSAYTATFTVTVNAKSLTITANNQSFSGSSNSQSLSQINYSSSGLVNSDTISTVIIQYLGSNTFTLNATGTYSPLTISGATFTRGGNSVPSTNYNIGYSSAQLIITSSNSNQTGVNTGLPNPISLSASTNITGLTINCSINSVLTYNGNTGISYATNAQGQSGSPNWDNMLTAFTVTATDSNGNPVSNVPSGVNLIFTLPNTNTTKLVKLYKFDSAQYPTKYILLDPQPPGYGQEATSISGFQYSYTLTNLSDIGVFNGNGSTICFVGTTRLLMADGTYKYIKDIVRNDMIMINKLTGESKQVARTFQFPKSGEFVKIPKNLIGNEKEIICVGIHPFWVNNDNCRVLANNIVGVEIFHDDLIVYNLQFEDESTFYVEGVKVDSLSPNHKKFKLDKSLYFNPNKYDEKAIVLSENDNKSKPKLIEKYNPNE
jgi:hypothetical protein